MAWEEPEETQPVAVQVKYDSDLNQDVAIRSRKNGSIQEDCKSQGKGDGDSCYLCYSILRECNHSLRGIMIRYYLKKS